MAKYLLSNGTVSIEVESLGAELRSLKKADQEYMWQADPAFWKRTAPVLFPLVGSLNHKAYRSQGVTYPMGQHGFARDHEFSVIEQKENSITLRLQTTEQLKAAYPYDFILDITYTLEENSVITTWKVTNPSEHEMYFSIGGHPAFLCEPEGAFFHLYGDSKTVESISYQQLTEDGLVYPELHSKETPQGMLPITRTLFEKDALILPDSGIHKVSLVNPLGVEYLTVEYEADLLGLWSPAGKSAPFVCIEPWYGRADAFDYEGDWEHRAYTNRLEGKESFTASYKVTVS